MQILYYDKQHLLGNIMSAFSSFQYIQRKKIITSDNKEINLYKWRTCSCPTLVKLNFLPSHPWSSSKFQSHQPENHKMCHDKLFQNPVQYLKLMRLFFAGEDFPQACAGMPLKHPLTDSVTMYKIGGFLHAPINPWTCRMNMQSTWIPCSPNMVRVARIHISFNSFVQSGTGTWRRRHHRTRSIWWANQQVGDDRWSSCTPIITALLS